MTHSIERQDSATTLDWPDEYSRTELAARDNHGISVKLFWTRGIDLLTVTVSDAANDEYFELVLDAEDQPLDVFHHPYAHAAARGLEFDTRPGAPEVMIDA
jgi:hypothetical protein